MKRITITLSADFEVEVDDRLSEEDARFAIQSQFEHSDGRQHLSTEIFLLSARNLAEAIAQMSVQTTGYRIARRYPGLVGRGWMMADRMRKPSLTSKQEVCVYATNTDTFWVCERDL